METELKCLQNAADDLNLKVVEHKKYPLDKRKTIKKFLVCKEKDGRVCDISPVMDYE